jgi:ribonuclease P protein component
MQASREQSRSLLPLVKRADFLKINQKGKRWTAHGLVLQALPNTSGEMRVGFTVTKKTFSSAVKRNRIKRRLRAAAADILPLHATQGYDYVLIGRQLSATRPYNSLCSDLKWCLEKLELQTQP